NCVSDQFESNGPLHSRPLLIFPVPESIEAHIKTEGALPICLTEITAANEKFCRGRDFRRLLQQIDELANEIFMEFEREPQVGIRKQKIHIRAKFPGGGENVLLRIQFGSRPCVAFSIFQNTSRRVNPRNEIAKLGMFSCLRYSCEQLRLSLQVKVAAGACRIFPGKLETVVIRAEFDSRINLHAEIIQ